ncbi:MAG: glycosyltransferase [Gemmatimonadales bacterium]
MVRFLPSTGGNHFSRTIVCRSLGRMLDRRLPRRASHVIAVSEEIRNTLLELAQLPEDRIDVIPNGVESTLFDVIEPDRRQTEDDRIVAFAGNLAPHQGIEHLLAAWLGSWGSRTPSS